MKTTKFSTNYSYFVDIAWNNTLPIFEALFSFCDGNNFLEITPSLFHNIHSIKVITINALF
jgi:hypothetical protein